MSVQICEGVWRNRCGQRLYITEREPLHGQRWTDGLRIYSDDGSWALDGHETTEDLVEYIGPLPDQSQRAPVSRPAETESTTAVGGGVSDDPGRIIHNLEQRLEAAKNRNSQALNQLVERDQAINEKTAEIDRLQAQWRSEFNAAQQLRAENESLTVRLQRAEVAAAEALQRWEATEQVCLRIITALAGVRS